MLAELCDKAPARIDNITRVTFLASHIHERVGLLYIPIVKLMDLDAANEIVLHSFPACQPLWNQKWSSVLPLYL